MHEAHGQHPWRWKPFYCILHPLDLDDAGRIVLPPVDALLAEPASCARPAQEARSPWDLFAAELTYLGARFPKNDGARPASPAAAS